MPAGDTAPGGRAGAGDRATEHAVVFEDGAVTVDAAVVAEAFGLVPEEVLRLMRDGAITGRCARGEGGDAGRWRLDVFHGHRALHLVVDGTGRVLWRRTAERLPPLED